jgi:hypothetical protein
VWWVNGEKDVIKKEGVEDVEGFGVLKVLRVWKGVEGAEDVQEVWRI